MELTQKEVSIIKNAIKARKKNRLLNPFLLVIMIIGLLSMFLGGISGDSFVYLAFFLIFLAILSAKTGSYYNYDELLDLLEKQIPKRSSIEELLANELKKT